jgi:putative hydrolase of the HAD superfamily
MNARFMACLTRACVCKSRLAEIKNYSLIAEKLAQFPIFLAEAHRAASLFHLPLYPGVMDTLWQLRQKYHLAIVSDAQTAYAIPELNAVGLSDHFDPITIPGNFGYRKPDERMFTSALTAMKMKPSEILFVGNDMVRDVYGAQLLGINTIFFNSNQGTQEKDGVKPDYIIYKFPELLNAIRFFATKVHGRPFFSVAHISRYASDGISG